MANHSWPTAVTSWEDTVKFAQLLFGTGVRCVNYGDRLPHASRESFLLFAKGACKSPEPFSCIGDLIPKQLAEIEDFEKTWRNNVQNPQKSQQMLGRQKGVVYYYSCQLTRAPCTCRSIFGADAHQRCISTTSCLWKSGKCFAEMLDATLQRNVQSLASSGQPVWLQKSWQAVWNLNDHNEHHQIDLHQDRCSTYSYGDPITSFSFGHGGVLTLSSATRKANETMLFQEHGDVLIMAGKFQSEFLHGVPARKTWKSLCDGPMFAGMQDWEQQGMREEVELHEKCQGRGKHLRYNCTLRWHDTHWRGCPEHKPEPVMVYAAAAPVTSSAAAASGSLPAVAGSGGSLQQTPLLGFKKRSVESLQETNEMEAAKSHRTVGVLLHCLGALAKEDSVLWAMIKSLPLVDAKALDVDCLKRIEQTAMRQRNELLRASEAALELGVDLPESVSYASLNAIATATQQRREIQEIFGGLCGQGSMWVREIVCPPFCNLLKDDMGCRRLRLTHQQVQDLLKAANLEVSKREKVLVVPLKQGGVAVLPQQVTCARRHPHQATQKRNQNFGTEMYDLSYGKNLYIKGFEMHFCIEGGTDENSGRRILLQKTNFEKVANEKGVAKMLADVTRGILKCLEHLRTMDADRQFVNRNCGRWVSENYDIWVWAQADDGS